MSDKNTQNHDWVDAGGGVQRRVRAENQELMVVEFKFEKDNVGALHSHPHTQSTYVQSGVFDFELDGKTQRVTAGDSFIIPSNTVHGCKCIEAGLLIDCFTPRRNDFL